jgi:hypothetical protein
MNSAQRRFCFAVALLLLSFGGSFLYRATAASASIQKGTATIALVGGAVFFSLGLALVYLGFSVPRKNAVRHGRQGFRIPSGR